MQGSQLDTSLSKIARVLVAIIAATLPASLLAASPAPENSARQLPPPPATHTFFESVETFKENTITHPIAPFELVPGKDPNGWSFVIEPYVWAMGISGRTGVGGFPSLNVNVDSRKVLQNLDWAIFSKAEIRKGRWGILGDGFFAQLSGEGTPPGPLYDNANLRVQQGQASLALAYRIIDDRRGFLDIYAGARYNYLGVSTGGSVDSAGVQRLSDAATSRLTSAIIGRVDNFIRTRPGATESDIVNDVRQNLTDRLLARATGAARDLRDSLSPRDILRIMNRVRNRPDNFRELAGAIAQDRLATAKDQRTPAIRDRLTTAQRNFSKALARRIENALPTSAEDSVWWVDPIIGLRGQINITRWLFLAAQGDVGGFGVGSQITWNAQATVGVNFTRTIFAEFGYRYMYEDYDKNSFLYQMSSYGLFSSIGVKF